jgi:PAS domain S-box-containing protein
MLELQRRQSRHILNSIPTVVYHLAVTSKGFPTQWISDSVKKILGYEVEDALAPDWWIDCLHPEDKAAALKKTSILMAQGHLVQEYRFRPREGRYLWIRDEATLLRDAYGQPKEIIGFWSNITERKQAEQQAVQAGRLDIVEDELTRLNNRIALRVVVGAMIVGSCLLLLRQEAYLKWGVPIIGLTFFALGCGLGLILFWRVVNSDNRSRHILNFIPTVIYDLAVAPKGFPTQWISDSVTKILGYEVDAALAPGWWIGCLHPDDKEAAVKKTSVLMTEGHMVQEYRFRAKDGRYLWIRDEASLLRDADGRPKQVIGFWSSITERKEAEQQAAQALKQELERGEFIRSSDRNIAIGTVLAILIIGPFLWGITSVGLTIFVVSCSLGLMLIWRLAKSGKYY